MKYPLSIKPKLDEIEGIIASWAVSISMDDIVRWVLQFEVSDYELALRVLRNLNVVGQQDINDALIVANSKLQRRAREKGRPIEPASTLFAGLGKAGKSGAMIGYHFRVLNGISARNFVDSNTLKDIESGNIKNLVLVDDVVSTGSHATKEINELTETLTPLGVENIYLLTICGFSNGLNKVSEETKAYPFSAFEYGVEDTVASLDGSFYQGLTHEARGYMQARLKDYGKALLPGLSLGYGDIGGLLVFHYNTPNTTLPIIWSYANGWIPLFPRANTIWGIERYSKELNQSRLNKVNNQRRGHKPSKATTLFLFVEGKIEEIVFGLLLERLSRELGFTGAQIVTLGGAMNSVRLLQDLQETHKSAVFLLDADVKKHVINSVPDSQRVVFLEPSIVGLLDLNRLATDGLIPELPHDFVESGLLSESIARDVEMVLFKRGSRGGRNLETIVNKVVTDYLDERKFALLIEDIKSALKKSSEDV